MNQYTKAWQRGWKAYHDHSDTNPYDYPHDNKADWWDSGWHAAEMGCRDLYAKKKK